MSRILAAHRRIMCEDSSSMTAAQMTMVAAQLATHPAAKLVPDIAAEIAAWHGWPIHDPQPSPGAVLLARARR